VFEEINNNFKAVQTADPGGTTVCFGKVSWKMYHVTLKSKTKTLRDFKTLLF
jgi:hypothetical protein